MMPSVVVIALILAGCVIAGELIAKKKGHPGSRNTSLTANKATVSVTRLVPGATILHHFSTFICAELHVHAATISGFLLYASGAACLPAQSCRGRVPALGRPVRAQYSGCASDARCESALVLTVSTVRVQVRDCAFARTCPEIRLRACSWCVCWCSCAHNRPHMPVPSPARVCACAYAYAHVGARV